MPRWNPQNELEREPRRQRCAPFKTTRTRTRCAIILLHYGALDAARLEASIGSCPRTRQGEGGSGWRASLQPPSLRQREGGVRGREGQGVSANAMPCARDRSFILPASYASAVPCSRREEGRPAALVSTLLRGNEEGWKVGRVLR